jgi:hypothetical protein
MGNDAETEPNEEITANHDGYQAARIGTRTDEPTKDAQQRYGGRQHHRRRHQDPAKYVEERWQEDLACRQRRTHICRKAQTGPIVTDIPAVGRGTPDGQSPRRPQPPHLEGAGIRHRRAKHPNGAPL